MHLGLFHIFLRIALERHDLIGAQQIRAESHIRFSTMTSTARARNALQSVHSEAWELLSSKTAILNCAGTTGKASPVHLISSFSASQISHRGRLNRLKMEAEKACKQERSVVGYGQVLIYLYKWIYTTFT